MALRRRISTSASAPAPETECVSDLEEVSAPVNAVLGAVLAVEQRLSWVRRRRGVSLIAVAERS